MTQDELVQALRRISPDQQAEIDVLAKKVVKDSRALPRAAAAHLSDVAPNVAANAMSLLIDIEDLAALPLMEAPEPPEAYDRVARMTIVVDGQLELRATIVERLRKMLDDKRPLNYKKMTRVEETPPESRVCDEAYALLRRLLNTSEDKHLQMENIRVFLRLSESRRDIEIKKAHNLKSWSDFGAAE